MIVKACWCKTDRLLLCLLQKYKVSRETYLKILSKKVVNGVSSCGGASQKDNRLKILRLQGGYLYDKGENDEQIFRVGLHNRFTNIILSSLSKNVKEFFKKF